MTKNLRRICGASLICLSLAGTSHLALAVEADPCGWQAGMVAAALVGGFAYFFGAEEAAGLLTGVAGGYGALDYLKVPCPSLTEDLNQSCVDSLAGCDEDPSQQGQSQGNPGQDQGGDDGSQS